MSEERGPYWVNFWGSHPDEDNDDCFTGDDYATRAEAKAAWERGSPDYTVAFVELDGPGINAVRANAAYDRRRCEREAAAERESDRREHATQAGMMGGAEAYNDAMGWGGETPDGD